MRNTLSEMLIALHYKNYRLLWIGVLFGNAARWVFTVGNGWIINSTTHSSNLVMISMLATMIPAVAFGPLIGVVLDKLSPKSILVFGIGLSGLANLMIGLFQLSGNIPIFAEIMTAFLVGTGFTIQMTASNTLIAYTVPKSIVPNATLIQGTINEGTGLAGSILLGPLVALLGYHSLFVFCFLLYTAALMLILPIHAEMMRENSLVISDGFREGIHYLRNHAKVVLLMCVVGLHCVFTMCYDVMLPNLISNQFDHPTHVFNTIITIIGVGSLIGVCSSVFVSSPKQRVYLFMISGVLSAVGPMCISGIRPLILVYVGAFLTGLFQTVFMAISLTSILTENANFRGRLSGVFTFVVMGAMATGTFVWGSLQMTVSPRILLTAGSLVFLMTLFVYAVFSMALTKTTLVKAFSFVK